MSSITTDQGILHYETFGRGKPVILLHGWLGSWGLWREVMTWLGQYYRTYALDFWGFGESGKKRETYHVQDFVALVDQFMDRLGIVQAPLVGHSMGGTVNEEEPRMKLVYLVISLLPPVAVVALAWYVVRAISVRVTWRETDVRRLDDEPA